MSTNTLTPGGASSALEERRAMMLGAPVLPTLLKLTFPVIAVVVAQTFVAILEAYWVSRLGTEAVAGVSLVLPLLILMGTMSNGGIGGGVSSAVARAIGAGRQADADALVLHTVIVALAFGLAFTLDTIFLGPRIYSYLGGRGQTLDFALAYSAWVFGGAPLIWTVNLLASAMRGAGEVRIPALVSLVGAVVLIPLSPILIFGLGPFPRLGVGGAGAATLIFYVVGLAVYLRHLLRGQGALRLHLSRLRFRHFRSILGVGLLSAIGTLVASLTVVGVTGAVGTQGTAALAGYGIASRIDSLLVPLLFSVGSGVVTLIGVATGAGNISRGNHIARIACTIAFGATQSVGLLLVIFPSGWLHLFSADPSVLTAGSTYLRVVAPSYGCFGVGLMLYFASQGRSNMVWPFVAGSLRLAVTVAGAAWLASSGASLALIVAPVAAGSVVFGLTNAAGFFSNARRLAARRHQLPRGSAPDESNSARRSRVRLPEDSHNRLRGAAAMAAVRMYRGHWVADYYDARRRRRIERPEGHFKKAREEIRAAQILLADRVAEVADGLVHQGRGTFEDAAARWLKSKVRVRPSTRRSYEHLLVCYLIPYFGDRKLRLIQVTDIERYRAELSQGIPDSIRQAFITRLLKAKPGLADARAKQRANRRKLGRRSINKALTVLSMVFNYAVRNQWLMRNPAKYVAQARDERPLEQRPLDMDILTPKEVAALREAATPASYRSGKLITNNYRLLISFAAFTGCRVGEILGAAWSHIDWESGQFHVRRTFKEGRFQEPKTRTSYRRLSLPTFLLKELRVWRLACPKGPYDLIFPNLDGRPMSHSNLLTRGFNPALKRAGLRKIRFHDLRHTFASLMISNGEDIVRVSRLMGHATASFTLNVYSHMLPREHDPSGDRLASLVFGNKMETVANLPTRLERPSAENLSESA